MQQREVRLVAIKRTYFWPLAYTPFHFSRTLPLKEGEEGGTEVRVIGLVGKNPVFLRCEICGVVLSKY